MKTIHTTQVGAADLRGKLLLIRCNEVSDRDTKDGPKPAAACDWWEVLADGTIGETGETLFFQQVLVPALTKTVGEIIAVRIEQPEKAFVFDKITEAEDARCEKAHAALTGAVPVEADAPVEYDPEQPF